MIGKLIEKAFQKLLSHLDEFSDDLVDFMVENKEMVEKVMEEMEVSPDNRTKLTEMLEKPDELKATLKKSLGVR